MTDVDADVEATNSGGRTGPWGCVILLLGLTCLGLLALWGLSNLVKGMDGYPHRLKEQPSGSSGSVADPLTPGASATYKDGLKVTVSEPRREPGGRAHQFTITYENGTDESLHPGGSTAKDSVSESEYDDAPLVVQAGERLDGSGRDEGTSEWINREQAGRLLQAPIDEGDSITVPVRVSGERIGMHISVVVRPPDHPDRDSAYWQLTLR